MVRDDSLSPEGFANRQTRVSRENASLLQLLKRVFYITPCDLGEDPSAALRKEAQAHPIPGAKTADVSEGVIVATGYAKGYIDAVRTRGYCPWNAAASKNPLAVQMFIFPHTNQADVFPVKPGTEVQGPMPPGKVKTDFPEFASIELPAAAYYVWVVEMQTDFVKRT